MMTFPVYSVPCCEWCAQEAGVRVTDDDPGVSVAVFRVDNGNNGDTDYVCRDHAVMLDRYVVQAAFLLDCFAVVGTVAERENVALIVLPVGPQQYAPVR